VADLSRASLASIVGIEVLKLAPAPCRTRPYSDSLAVIKQAPDLQESK